MQETPTNMHLTTKNRIFQVYIIQISVFAFVQTLEELFREQCLLRISSQFPVRFWIEQGDVSRSILHEALNCNIISNAECSLKWETTFAFSLSVDTVSLR